MIDSRLAGLLLLITVLAFYLLVMVTVIKAVELNISNKEFDMYAKAQRKQELLSTFDFNKDGRIDFFDRAVFLNAWGELNEINKTLSQVIISGRENEKPEPRVVLKEVNFDPNFLNDPNFMSFLMSLDINDVNYVGMVR